MEAELPWLGKGDKLNVWSAIPLAGREPNAMKLTLLLLFGYK
jgi:hypothetical protein